jgi:thioredoxin 1
MIGRVLAEHPHVRHIKIEDGKGKRLGRSFGVKLWPTFVVIHDGSEVGRVVRPRDISELRDAVARAGVGTGEVPERRRRGDRAAP